MAVDNAMLGFKHHILNGRLAQAKKALASAQLSLDDCVDEDGNTAMHWCSLALAEDAGKREVSDQEAFVFLLQNGAPRNRQNALGETPLLAAVRLATLDPKRAEALVGDMLTKGQADPSRADMSGETPLMEAAAAGLEPLGRLLLEARANPLVESQGGLTAAQLADESGSQDFVALLKSPLAERAAKEARTEEAEGKTKEELERASEARRERKAKKFEQTLFGQKLKPGLAHDKDAPGKPYPEHGTLHDID